MDGMLVVTVMASIEVAAEVKTSSFGTSGISSPRTWMFCGGREDEHLQLHFCLALLNYLLLEFCVQSIA
jgi:hypothetical protein